MGFSKFSTDRKVLEILDILRESRETKGAKTIADSLRERGYPITERGVRYYLKMLDDMEFTKKVGQVGRMITEKGLKELEEGRVHQRVGFVISHVEELIYHTTFDPMTKEGSVIVNSSYIDKEDFEKAMELMNSIEWDDFVISKKVAILEEGSPTVPPGSIGLGTLCSITFNGVLVKNGVPVRT
ncbi:MAG: NrpR regulatory domain-containing protein, partial [Methermicoccaceae archaeon]